MSTFVFAPQNRYAYTSLPQNRYAYTSLPQGSFYWHHPLCMNIDPTLLKRCCDNDRKAHNELYKLLYSPLMSVCYRYAQDMNEAQSYLNQGFVKIILNLGSYTPDKPFLAWARRVQINTILDEHRKQKKHRENMVYDGQDQHFTNSNLSVDNAAEEAFTAEVLAQMLKQLAPMTANIFNLFAIDGYSHKEIAEMMHITEGTSKWHVSTARQQLRNMLQNHLAPVTATNA